MIVCEEFLHAWWHEIPNCASLLQAAAYQSRRNLDDGSIQNLEGLTELRRNARAGFKTRINKQSGQLDDCFRLAPLCERRQAIHAYDQVQFRPNILRHASQLAQGIDGIGNALPLEFKSRNSKVR